MNLVTILPLWALQTKILFNIVATEDDDTSSEVSIIECDDVIEMTDQSIEVTEKNHDYPSSTDGSIKETEKDNDTPTSDK